MTIFNNINRANKLGEIPGLVPVPFSNVVINDKFWAPRLANLRNVTLPLMFNQMQEANYFNAAQRGWKRGMKPTPFVFWETDITKWLEAASYSLRTHPDSSLEAMLNQAIDFLVSLQQPDGYLNLYFTEVEPEKRWTNLRDWHELYCAGHLIEAGVAHFETTGKRTLLDPVCRYADYIDSVFGPAPGQRRGYDGHEEIELALVKLYRVTGEGRYLNLARFFVEERGRQPHFFDIEAWERGEDPANFWQTGYEYNQSHQPVLEQSEIVGHAVRAVYLYSAVADLAKEYNNETVFDTCLTLWNHLSSKRIYITGGIGPSAHNEGFTKDYDLPNLTAYAETCAATGLVFWSHRMLQLDPNSRYADIIERALYNGILSGISLDGSAYFYENPLASKGTHHRQKWYKCACCPPNLARLFMSLGQYIYSVKGDTQLQVHLYIQNEVNLQLGGRAVTVRQLTDYPWDGTIRLEIEPQEPAEFELLLRIPGWCKRAALRLNHEELNLEIQKGYARVNRRWQKGDFVELVLDMPVRRQYSNPAVEENIQRVAITRGPLVYCLETADTNIPLNFISLSDTANLTSRYDPTILGGIAVIEGEFMVIQTQDWEDQLYRSEPPTRTSFNFKAIPYYAWDNREAGEMQVWLRTNRT
ncbi:MAG TPA: beta-L-arabinofuranosidase domain-containing protein [Chloroflexia bacterium]|nr:beta-L-arabinofuranosidase domain-containing protein [Chloroflexia bacterium]